MGNGKIEEAAVNAIADYFQVCDYVDTRYIKKGDKGPEWDGDLLIYDMVGEGNKNLHGRISVQVKGTKRSKFTSTQSHDVALSSLKNYLRDGGLVYFKVQVNLQTRAYRIFYICLTPILIKRYLQNGKGQSTISIKLKEAPSDEHEFVAILKDFHRDSKKQTSFYDKPILTMEEAKKKGFKKFSMTWSGVKPSNIFDISSQREAYVYGIADNGFEYPIGDCPVKLPIESLSKDIFLNVTIGGKQVAERVKQIVKRETLSFSIKDTISLIFRRDEIIPGVDYKVTVNCRSNASNLYAKVEELELISALMKSKEITIDNQPFYFCEFQENREVIENQMFLYGNLKNLLLKLHITQDVDISNISKEEWEMVEIMYRGVVMGEDLELGFDDSTSVIFECLGLKIILYAHKLDNRKFKLIDLTEIKSPVEYKDREGRKHRTSCYSYFINEGIMVYDNIPCEDVVGTYASIDEDPDELCERCNEDVLTLLGYIDREQFSSVRKTLLLSACKELMKWIISTDENKEERTKSIHLLNLLQINLRERELSDKEKQQLYSIATNPNLTIEISCGALLLLGAQDAFQNQFDKLPEETKTNFKNWPIYHFFKY